MEVNYTIKRKKQGRKERKKRHTDKEYLERETKIENMNPD